LVVLRRFVEGCEAFFVEVFFEYCAAFVWFHVGDVDAFCCLLFLVADFYRLLMVIFLV
jgi:hypothetical protein